MIQFFKALQAWGTAEFSNIIKIEIEELDATLLPLQQGLSVSSAVAETQHTVLILAITDDARFIHAKAGIYYSGIVAGCSCADDPTPLNETPEYCVILVKLDKHTAEATVALLSE